MLQPFACYHTACYSPFIVAIYYFLADHIVDLLCCEKEDIIAASAKTGEGIENILNCIIEKIPSPKGDINAPLQAMIFDSVYNTFRGIEAYFKVVNGEVRKGQKVKFMATNLFKIPCL